jgi:hypothetical protein
MEDISMKDVEEKLYRSMNYKGSVNCTQGSIQHFNLKSYKIKQKWLILCSHSLEITTEYCLQSNSKTTR